jgi:hypothetical protein
MKQKNFLIAFICFLVTANLVAQTTYYVSSSGNDGNGGLSSGDAFLTIDHAVTTSISNDVVIIDGSVSQTEEVSLGKNLIFQGQSDAIINGDGSNRLFNLSTIGLTISFTDIIFQSISSSDQGAVLNNTQNGAILTFTDCVFSGNTTSSTGGGGAIVMGGDGTTNFTNCTFYNNSTTGTTGEARGGAIIVYSTATVNVTKCTFFENSVPNRTGNFHGAAIRASSGGTTVIATNCLFYNNTTSDSNADFNAVGAANMTMINSIAQFTNNLDTNTNSNITADLTNSSLAWNGTLNKVTFTAASVLTDDTPIDFGNDSEDVGSYDSSINLFKGTTDSNWDTADNWSGTVPSATDNATFLSDSPSGIIGSTTGAVTNNLSVNAPSSLTINSSGSLIASGTSAGNITYNRTLGTTNWYMVSSPVIGQGIVDFYTTESPALGTGTGDAQNVAIAPYDNSQALATDRWNYYTEGQVDGVGGDDTTDTFTSGTGYTVQLGTPSDIAFTGTMPVDNFTALNLTDNSGGSGNAFNLMGNPYPSYIASDNTANATNNILTVNSGLLTEQTIWIWDQSFNSGAGRYETRNNTSNFHIAPGQAFFVSASGASSSFAINENMQSHQSDTFLRTVSTRPEINLGITDGTSISDTAILYIDGTTTGFDNGYDSSMFGGVANDFSIYTQVVENGTGKNLGIQSLPNNNYENMIIPVGVIAEAGEITFSTETTNLPSGLKVFLEDRENNTFIRLDETNTSYKVNLDSSLSDVGRFYIHTSSSSLTVEDSLKLESVSIYKSNATTLKLVGLQQGDIKIKLFNILGKQVLNSSFKTNGVKDISLPNLATGVYIVHLETEAGILNKKIVLE